MYGMQRDADVIVVGGGPAGAASALHLSRMGLAVTLVDRARFPREKPCAEYLGPEAVAQLDSLGLLDEVRALGGARLTRMLARSPDGTEFGASLDGIGVPRRDLDDLLVRVAARSGVRVIQQFKVHSVHHEDTKSPGVIIGGVESGEHDRTLRVLRAFVVIGADGIRSVVARRMGPVKRLRFPSRYACVTHYAGVAGISDQVEMHVTPSGCIGLADVGGGRTSVGMVVPSSLMHEARGNDDIFLDNWIRSQPHLAERFARASRLKSVRTTGPFATFPRRVWAPRVALVGDAAGFMDPITGQGVASALHGAELLAPLAAEAARAGAAGDARERDRALRAYARAHKRAFRSQWLLDRAIAFVVAHPSLIDRAARVLATREELSGRLLAVSGGSLPWRAAFDARLLAGLLLPAAR